MKNRQLLIAMFALTGLVLAYTQLSHNERVDDAAQFLGMPKSAVLVAVRVPELSSIAQSGMKVFDANCAACHGTNAAGKEGIAPPLVHKIYEPGHHSDAAFSLAVKNGVRAHHWSFGNMPPIDGLTEEEMFLLVNYVRELQRANGIF